ncbi:hypothetical protein GUITHDRAFT_146114 [Guillardia theta CCMP2712]|uniref:SAP domain-containing protein n=2 Tax=Guillardia theta TaxID=55529 RepID=L1IJ59_GUITC|nr:hypothetical protein GUITHDRAFT_146114 [Guillardia theta CCMP2712]EKX35959.1 hypothetical protein GUITHDRAFT_146114 [Guillardia theta CCMP2712]|eukprot:XP_005822939.1 hypothetical protein GUITHDRAFT_146114 [Guillardia theta CCMP2712]
MRMRASSIFFLLSILREVTTYAGVSHGLQENLYLLRSPVSGRPRASALCLQIRGGMNDNSPNDDKHSERGGKTKSGIQEMSHEELMKIQLISRVPQMKLDELKEELKRRGLEIKGKKQDLVDRLKEAISNDVAVQVPVKVSRETLDKSSAGRRIAGESMRAPRSQAEAAADPMEERRMEARVADLREDVYLPSSPPPPEVYLQEQRDFRENLRRQAMASPRAEFQPRSEHLLRPSDADMLRQAADRQDGWVSVRDLETKRQEQEANLPPQPFDRQESHGFGTQAQGRRWGPGEGGQQGYKGALRCSFCNKVGHSAAQCYFRKNSFSRDSSERSYYRHSNFQGAFGNKKNEEEVASSSSPVPILTFPPLQSSTIPEYDDLSEESTPSSQGGYHGFEEALDDSIPELIDLVDDTKIERQKVSEAMKCPHGLYKTNTINYSKRRADRERAAGTLLQPDVYTDEELYSVGYTKEKIETLRRPPSERHVPYFEELLAPVESARSGEAQGKEGTRQELEEEAGCEGPVERDTFIAAIGGSITFR